MNNILLIIASIFVFNTGVLGNIKSYITVIHCDGIEEKGRIDIDQNIPYDFKWFDTKEETYSRSNLEPGNYVLEYKISESCYKYEIIEIIDIETCELELLWKQVSDCTIKIWFEVKSGGKNIHPSSFYDIVWKKNGITISLDELDLILISNHEGEYCISLAMHGNCCGSSPLADCVLLPNIQGCLQELESGGNGLTGNETNHLELVNEFDIFPNPSNGELYMSINSAVSGSVVCEWTTMVGTRVNEIQLNLLSSSLEIVNLQNFYDYPSGMLLFTVKFPDGEIRKKKVLITK